MWVTQHNNAGWDCFKILTSQEILWIQNPLLVEHCAFLEVIHLFQSVSRTHRVALDWLCDRTNLDPKIQIKYIDTKNQLADILTNGNFTRGEWNHLLCLFSNSHFSSTNCLGVMSKKTQEETGEERVTAKSKPMMNLVSRYSARDPNVLASTASERPGKTRSEIQVPLSSWNEQQPRTGIPVMGARSSDYSEWNMDDKWSSQEWKSVEIVGSKNGETRG